MKLKIEHLTPYLPYKIYLKDVYNNDSIGELRAIERSIYPVIIQDRDDFYQIEIEKVKPILYPLSDLTKEIEVNGVKFVPLDMLWEEANCDAEKEFIYYAENNIFRNPEKIRFAPYSLINKLFQWHFDVFGLIEQGLAIDKNSLK